MNNSIYLRRQNKVFVPPGAENLPDNYVAAILKNIESLGYTFSPGLIERLKTVSLVDLTEFYKRLIEDLRKMTGAHRPFKPMYPNFPEQVMEMSESRLYLNAIVHYLTNLLPAYEKKERLPLLDNVNLKAIELGSVEDFEQILSRLTAANTSLSSQDKEDLRWFVENYRDDVYRLLPETIKIKENLAYTGSLLIQYTEEAENFLQRRIKTATDVLRLATAISGGDVSLAENTKFITFSRSTRRLLLELLEKTGDPTEDMLRWKKRWIRLGEKLHPGEFAARFPRSFAAFDTLRNDKPFETFNGKVERAIGNRDAARAIELLDARAGEFARRLDKLLQIDENAQNAVLAKFVELAEQISTPVLLQTTAHFKHRREPAALRTFFPKGNVAKVQAIENNLPPLPAAICHEAVKICENALVNRFKNLPPLGRCFLDERLRNFIVPFSQRSASKSLRTIARGSRLALPEANVIRFFLWWKNGKERADIDLSAALYDRDFNYRDIVSYYNLKNYGGHHSGDIVDAPDGAAEFIDIDIAKTVEAGARYVVVSLNSFTRQPYCDLPECFAGWMARTAAASGEIFEPKTVADRIDLTSDTRICIPAIVDLIEREVVWTDIALKNSPLWNNVHQNLRGVSLMAKAMTSLVKPNLYELFALHVAARGEPVDGKEKADRIFSVEEGVTPLDFDVISSEFM